MSDAARQRVLRRAALVSRATAYLAVWAVLAAAAGLVLFLLSSRTVVLATHDAVLRPNLLGQVVVNTGPVLPDFRIGSGGRVGVDIRLDKTDAESTEALVERYAFIATQPEGQIDKVRDALVDMALAAALRGAVLGLLPILVWLLIGAARRRELATRARSPGGAVAALLVVLLGVLLWEPWDADENSVQSDRSWVPLAEFVGPGVDLPDEAQGIEVRGDVTTAQTRRLVESAIDTYAKSKTFYRDAAEEAAALDLRQPDTEETVVALVSDRHDNVGMDAVARAVADAGGAAAVFDAGDDTSSGKSWEAFSLDSVSTTFEDLDRWAVAGNHDHGSFVRTYLDERGWTMLDGEVGRRARRREAARRRRPAVQRPRQLARRDRAQLRGGGVPDRATRPATRGSGSPRSSSTTPTSARRRSTAAARTWSSGGTCTCRSAPPAWWATTARRGTPTRTARPAAPPSPSRWAASRAARPR